MNSSICFFYVTFEDGYEDTFTVYVTWKTGAMRQLLEDFTGDDNSRVALAAIHGDIVKVELIKPKQTEE